MAASSAAAAPPVTTSATTIAGPEDASSATAPSEPAIRQPQQQQNENADATHNPHDPSTPSSAPGPLAVYGAPVPSETHFASREELLAYVHEFTVHHGYAVVIQKSNVPRGQVWLRCDLGGSYRSSTLAATPATAKASETANARKRKCSSRLKNCPFQLYARRLPDARWLLKVQHAGHNHNVAGDTAELVAHPVARRMTLAQKQFVDELTEMGARPALIVEKMKDKFPDKPIKVQDIYNTRNYIRRERSAGRVPFAEIADQDDAGEEGESEQTEAAVDGTLESVAPPRQPPNQQSGGEKEEATVAKRRRAPSSSLQQAAATPLPAPSLPAELPLAAETQEHRIATKQKRAADAAMAAQERMQTLLADVNENFAAWQPRTQKQFLFQLDVLLDKAKKGKHREASSRVQKPTAQQPSAASTTDSHSSDDAGASSGRGASVPPALL